MTKQTSNKKTEKRKTKFPERLKTLRLRKGYSQKELAEKVGVAANTVSVWERGERHPSDATCQNIAFVLDTSYEYLMCLTDDPAEDRADYLSDEEAAAIAEAEDRDIEEHMLNAYRDLDDETQRMVRRMIAALYRDEKAARRLRSQREPNMDE